MILRPIVLLAVQLTSCSHHLTTQIAPTLVLMELMEIRQRTPVKIVLLPAHYASTILRHNVLLATQVIICNHHLITRFAAIPALLGIMKTHQRIPAFSVLLLASIAPALLLNVLLALQPIFFNHRLMTRFVPCHVLMELLKIPTTNTCDNCNAACLKCSDDTTTQCSACNTGFYLQPSAKCHILQCFLSEWVL